MNHSDDECDLAWERYPNRTYITHNSCGHRVELRSNTPLNNAGREDAESMSCAWCRIPARIRDQYPHAHALDPDGSLAMIKLCLIDDSQRIELLLWEAELALGD
jgi:hypothetical protein